MRQILVLGSILSALFALPGAWAAAEPEAAAEPRVVTVQHILVGFNRSIPGRKIERTKAEARSLAERLLGRARSGEEFGDLVQEFTDDRYPGVMTVVNDGEPRRPDAYGRKQLQPCFGDVSFRLAVGEVGLADYSVGACSYGWHVIKRLE
jgi:hypothetical protein